MSTTAPVDTPEETLKNICLPLSIYIQWQEVRDIFGYSSDADFVIYIISVLRALPEYVGKVAPRDACYKVDLGEGEEVEVEGSADGGEESQSDTPVKLTDVQKVHCSHCNSTKHVTGECNRTCLQCGLDRIVFKKVSSLRQHERDTHEECRCDQCGERVTGRLNLDKHVREQHATPTPGVRRARARQVNYREMNEGRGDWGYVSDINVVVQDIKEEVVSSTDENEFPKVGKLKSEREMDAQTKGVGTRCKYCDSSAHASNQCKICHRCNPNVTFVKPSKFRDHWSARHVQRQCSVCSEKVVGRAEFNKHKHGHVPIKSESSYVSAQGKEGDVCHVCTSCGERFSTIQNLLHHEAKYHGEYRCERCSFVSESQVALNSHRQQEHSEDISDHNQQERGKSFVCKECGASFASKSSMHVHKSQMHSGPCECGICGQTFPHARALYNHRRSSHVEKPGADDVKCNCFKCGRVFRTTNGRHRHMIACYKSSGIKAEATVPTCSECGQTFKHRRDVFKHRQSEHTGECVCEVCGQTFANKFKLDSHRRSVHGKNPEGYLCGECGKRFETYMGRKVHQDKYHQGIRYQCGAAGCGKVYTTKNSLLIHISTRHETRSADAAAAASFTCPLCGAAFQHKHLLRLHMYRHKTVSRRTCAHCNKVMSSVGALRTHIEVVHKNVRTYQCRMCMKSYGAISHLQRHYKKNHEELRYHVSSAATLQEES